MERTIKHWVSVFAWTAAICACIIAVSYNDYIESQIQQRRVSLVVQADKPITWCRDIDQIRADVTSWSEDFGKYINQNQIEKIIMQENIKEIPGVNCTIPQNWQS